MENPFLHIVPREDEEIINMAAFRSNLEKSVSKSIKGGIIVMIMGDYGSGKSLFINYVKEKFSSKNVVEFSMSESLVDRIYELKESKKDIIVLIDNLDMINQRKDYISPLLETIVSKSILGITFVLACNPTTFRKIERLNKTFANMSVKLEVPAMDIADARKFVISRLNSIRDNKNSLEPFTEKEFSYIYSKSNGNPRMMLLLFAALFDRKTGLS